MTSGRWPRGLGREPRELPSKKATCQWLVLWLLPLLFQVGCGPSTPPLPSEHLWAEERVLRQIDEGWVWGVPLASARTLDALGADPRRHFRAVAVGLSESASLQVEQGERRQALDLSSPQPLDLELASQTVLRPEGEVLLLWPRKVDPLHRGQRVVLVVADTLRFDHANEQLMPGVSAYFADGLRHSRAYSAAPWTLPSMAALFTGQRPSTLRHPDGSLISIPEHQQTVASKFLERGFVTVGITANYTINHENGYSAGFDTFLAPPPRGRSGDFRDAQWVAQWARHHVRWLPDVDLFLYLQLMDPHDPYRDHERGGEWVAPQTGHQPAAGEVEALRRAYASEVRYLDGHLAALLPDLDAQRVVFTSDHGEEFFDHGGFRHGPALYGESVHVPLWIRGQGIATAVESQPVSLIDLHPVLLGDALTVAPTRFPVTMETFSFGPPRWGWVDGPWQWILRARALPVEPVETPVGRWLEAQHPLLQVISKASPMAAETRTVVEREGLPQDASARRVPHALSEHFQGFRRGLFVQVPTTAQRLELQDIDGTGWIWGLGDAELEALGEGRWALEAKAQEPFLLLFLSVEEGRSPSLVEADAGALRPLVDEGVELAGGLRIWFDSGRPAERLTGTQETLERLKALGYI